MNVCLRQYKDLLTLDQAEYIKGLEEAELSVMMAEIEKHTRDLEHINTHVPAVAVNIGPFAVSCKKILASFQDTKASLLQKTKELLASKPKKLCEEVGPPSRLP